MASCVAIGSNRGSGLGESVPVRVGDRGNVVGVGLVQEVRTKRTAKKKNRNFLKSGGIGFIQ